MTFITNWSDRILSQGFLDSRLVAIATSFLAIPVLTYFFTTAQHLIATSKSKNAATEPPVVPYSIPLLGSALPFSFNTAEYVKNLRKRYGDIPLQLQIGGMKLYFVPHGDFALTLFKHSRELSTKVLGILPLTRHFGMTKSDVQPFIEDDSGILPQPAAGFEHVNPDKRIWHVMHRDLQTLLMGTPLNVMTAKFVEIYTDQISNHHTLTSEKWTEYPDLNAFLQTEMLTAAIQALCGTKMLEQSPTFVEDFWAYDEGIPTIFKMIPRWLAPKPYRFRDKMVAMVQAWHENALKSIDSDNPEAMKDWDPVYGAKIMRARAKMYRNVGINTAGMGSGDLGMMWATNSNVIPATSWAIMDILRTGIEDRVRTEFEPCFAAGSFDVDVEKLCSRPLLQSIYMETLRLRSSAGSVRQPIQDGFTIGNWSFKKTGILFMMPWLSHRDTTFWNTGRDDDPHSVDEFWAERFLEYPGEPWSGPIRKNDKPEAYRVSGKKPLPKTADDDKKAKLVTSGIQGHYLPYGGGIKMCPGRFFAKQEMMAAIAVLLRACDIELLDRVGAERLRNSMSRFPFGTLVPDAKIPIRVRKRALR